jgi:UDP-4-amino-4,6-dideoxy-N-acetyl-beta-L-altrosamine N-acetyltransferase
MDATDNLRLMSLSDLEMVRSWRNAPEVRRVMVTRHTITAQEHQAWFERHEGDPARRLWIFERERQALGFIQWAGVQAQGRAQWGFYAVPGAPRGTGRAMCTMALNRIFNEVNLTAVEAEVMQDNIRSLALHEALGFELATVVESTYRDPAGRPIGLHRLVLTGAAWSRRCVQAS